MPRGGALPSALPRQVTLFGWVSLLNDFASEMIYPLLPAFVTGVLGAGPSALGALDGAAEFTAAFVKLAAGRLADRRPLRGRMIVIGYVVAVMVRPVIALTGAAWQVIGLRVVDRIGKGIRTPPRDALIADITPPAMRGRAFGLQRGMDHAGAVLGPLVAWWLLAAGHADLRAVIGASIAPGVVVVLLALWAVRDAARRQGEAPEQGRPGPAAAAAAMGADTPTPARAFAPLLAIACFYLLRMPDTLIILRSQQLGVPVAVVPLLWAAVHVVRSSSSFFAGARQGSGFGVYHSVTGFAALVGGVALGAAFQVYGAGPAFLVSALGGLALVVAWPVVASRRTR